MTSEPPADALLADRYELGAVLGGGGMATVREGWDTRLHRRVAVKVLHAHLAADPTMRRRFEDEGRTAARLAHPNIVQVYDSGETKDIPYLVMELVEGPTLARRIADAPVAPDEALAIATGIAHALAAAHEQGIVHRDIKPANVLMVDGIPKVTDFGIARVVEGLDRDTTTVILGTPAYVAPEHLAGEPATPRSDVYAAGVVLAEMLGGRRIDGDIDPSAMPAPLGDVVARATSRDPADRPADGAALAAALTATDESGPEPTERKSIEEAAAQGTAAADAPTVALAARTASGTTDDADHTRPLTSSATASASTRVLPPRPAPARPTQPRARQGRRAGPFAIAALGVLLLAAAALGISALVGGDDGLPAAPSTTTTTTTTVPATTTTVRAAPAGGKGKESGNAKAPKEPKGQGQSGEG